MGNTHFVPFTRQQNASKARPQLSNLSGYRYGAVSDNPRSGPSCIGRSSRPSQHARPPIHSPLPSISNPAVIIPLVSLACRTPHHLTAPPFPRFPNPASAGCWTRDRGSSLLCLAAFRSMLHSGGAYTAEAVSNSHPGTTCLSWAASLSQERNIGDIPLSHGTQEFRSSGSLSHSSFRKLVKITLTLSDHGGSLARPSCLVVQADWAGSLAYLLPLNPQAAAAFLKRSCMRYFFGSCIREYIFFSDIALETANGRAKFPCRACRVSVKVDLLS